LLTITVTITKIKLAVTTNHTRDYTMAEQEAWLPQR